ncbi:DUF3021 domain-containing protein [Streptococcus cuniculipharyngis]|uniref:DUF3021 domain-containing protein n=1 Tax=Streptococcus cuniculipharyngis TaxID=1562651 RepID=A0A5C5SBB2_9STRE|nr:DUF3021 domain-containing protein [Streptococcus cuniculipharyngis]TWS97655.1 DUF3021 domain-containing protein [Streptococcus cuniculipharyngis]
MKKIVVAASVGVGIGSFVFLWQLVTFQLVPSVSNVLSVSLVSALIGVVSLVYDIEKWSLWLRSFLHCLALFLLIGGMNVYNGWVNLASFADFIVNFFITYLIIWGILFVYGLAKAKKINQHLKERA